MSGSDVSLYDEVIEGLRCNRELELYYNDSTYGNCYLWCIMATMEK